MLVINLCVAQSMCRSYKLAVAVTVSLFVNVAEMAVWDFGVRRPGRVINTPNLGVS
jgi:hypothetical protein